MLPLVRLRLIGASYFTSKCGAAALRRCFSSRLHSAAADAAWGCLYNGAHLAEELRHTDMYVTCVYAYVCIYVCVLSQGRCRPRMSRRLQSPSPSTSWPTQLAAAAAAAGSSLHFTTLGSPCILPLSLSCPLNTFVSFMACKLASAARAVASCVSLCVSSAAAATVCACVWPLLSLLPSPSLFALAQSICCPLATKLRCCVWCENFDSNASFALKLRRSR